MQNSSLLCLYINHYVFMELHNLFVIYISSFRSIQRPEKKAECWDEAPRLGLGGPLVWTWKFHAPFLQQSMGNCRVKCLVVNTAFAIC